MKLETIYNELKDMVENGNDFNFIKYTNLMEKLEDAIRLESAYKTTSKTRVNAIKRVASKDKARPALTGYGIYGDYKVVTDSYHAILIYQDNMPLELKDNYPDVSRCIPEQDGEELPMVDMDDLTAFIKLNKKEKEPLYQIGECKYNANYVKNVIDILGKDDTKIYFYGENRPLKFKNSKNEIGIVLPIKVL
jgi:hypothetical protein